MFDSYKLRMAARGTYEGESMRRNSQKIMDASWMRDAATKPVYVKWVDSGLPEVNDGDMPVYAKYNVKAYHSIQGDEVNYLVQFKLEDMQNRPDIKVGSYVYIPDESGTYTWWLLVHYDDRPMFRQWSVLKCLHIYRWVTYQNGHRIVHECLGVPRSQSSYNSWVYIMYKLCSLQSETLQCISLNCWNTVRAFTLQHKSQD